MTVDTKQVKEPANKILVLFAHPVFQTSLLNQTLIEALPESPDITFHDLYEAYPNFMIDVAHEQQLLLHHDVIVFQHPMYWYSCPALLKEWMDLVLEHGFAYGTEGTALAGKKFISVISTGGAEENYAGVRNIRELLKPFEHTAKLCNMTFLPPMITYGGLRIKAGNFDQELPKDYLQKQVQNYKNLLNDLLNNQLGPELADEIETLNEHQGLRND